MLIRERVIFGINPRSLLSYYPNPNRMKYFFTLSFLLCCGISFAQTAPNFTVTNSDGQTRNLYNDYLNQGKVVVIEAFFTTCPPCNSHAPFWETLYQNQLAIHPGQVEFIMLSTLQSDNNDKVAMYKANKGLSMPGVGNNGGSVSALQPYTSGQFGDFQGTPTFILIKTDGEVVFDIRGPNPQATMNLIAQNVAAALTQTCALESPFGNPISDVHISATTTADMTANITSSATYTLSNLPQLQTATYTITASKTDNNPATNLSTFDLVLISKHILGLEPFTEPWQLIAADMNCSGSVTTFDIVVGRKLILGIEETFPCSPWKFIPQGSSTQSNGGCVDFLGVKLGDINGPYFAPPAEERTAFGLLASDRYLKAGERCTVEFFPNDHAALQSLQMEFAFDPNAVEIKHLFSEQLPGFNEECYNLARAAQGKVPLLWIDGNTSEVFPGTPAISMEIMATQDGRLSDLLHLRTEGLPAEMYDADLRRMQVDLRWQNPVSTAVSTARIFPNPARNAFQVSYESAEDSDLLLQMLDVQGKIVLEKTYSAIKGENRLQVETTDLVPGLHIVKINGRSLGGILLNR